MTGEASAQRLPAAGFAVLELFTSEGCSSCPPADRLLSQLAVEHAREQVFPLSFHVDYWNDLGWRDSFSSAEFSERQRRYAELLGRERIYTPQLVVNGRAEIVGSRVQAVRALLARALQPPAQPPPSLRLAASLQARALDVRSEVRRAPVGASLILLVVQRSARSRVTRGENAARTLLHTNVVRRVTRASASGRTRLAWPEKLSAGEALVVALLQVERSGAIVAAARAEVRGPS